MFPILRKSKVGMIVSQVLHPVPSHLLVSIEIHTVLLVSEMWRTLKIAHSVSRSRLSLLSKYHDVLRRTPKCNFINPSLPLIKVGFSCTHFHTHTDNQQIFFAGALYRFSTEEYNKYGKYTHKKKTRWRTLVRCDFHSADFRENSLPFTQYFTGISFDEFHWNMSRNVGSTEGNSLTSLQ